MTKIDDKQMQNLKRLLSVFDSDTLTKDDFLSSFKRVIDYVKQIERKNTENVKRIADTLTQAFKKFKNDNLNNFNKLSRETNSRVEKTLKTANRALNAEIIKIEKRLAEVRDGKDADEEKIVEEVLSKIELPEIKGIKKDLPKMGEQIRDALELLNGEDRLSAEAIDGLEKLVKKLIKKYGGGEPSIGGLRPAKTGIEVPSGTMNGTNKAFTVVWKPEFITLNGQILYEGAGYTLSSSGGVMTITLDNAPSSGELLKSHYKEL